MRFYQGLLPAILWDKKIGGPIVEFKRGIFDTEDEDIIALLHKRGYLTIEDVEILQAGGTLPHGGFEKVVDDSLLPSGRSPMDNPELAGGVPHAQAIPKEAPKDDLPQTESQDLARTKITDSGNILHGVEADGGPQDLADDIIAESEVRQRATGKRKRASSAAAAAKRIIKRRDKT